AGEDIAEERESMVIMCVAWSRENRVDVIGTGLGFFKCTLGGSIGWMARGAGYRPKRMLEIY
ncbi:MAG: hypothetical protein Q8L42_04100, partial [Sulfurimicrobium sp.]|nr:hypothetical protein [Sulfurimicrobium sp.]